MPYNQVQHTVHRENMHNILITREVYARLLSNEFDATYWPEAANGQKYVYPGLVLAQVQADQAYKYVPYDSSASYGTGSDTAVGVLNEFIDVTLGDQAVSPLYHGTLIEQYCYVGAGKTAVTATVKTHLTDINWV